MRDVPYGYCHCGCGQKTTLHKQTVRARGFVKGEPRKYIAHHHLRSSPLEYVEEDRGYETPCWIWQRSLDRNGYGQGSRPDGQRKAYRIYYERYVGRVPAGLHLDHLCRVRECVNPDHLEPVTQRENNLRGHTPAARNAVKTHCIRGHEFSPENTYVDSLGKRHCRTCHRRRNREAYLRKVAA